MSRRSKMIVGIAVSTSLVISGIATYQVLDRSPEAHSSATVLAPKVAAPNPTAAERAAGAAPKVSTVSAPSVPSAAAIATASERSSSTELPSRALETQPRCRLRRQRPLQVRARSGSPLRI